MDSNTLKRIKKLNKALNEIEDKINDFQKEELSLDQLESDTEFTGLHRLKKCYLKLWQEREKLLNISQNSGRAFYQKLKNFHGTNNTLINSFLEQYFNQYLMDAYQFEQSILFRRKDCSPASLEHFSMFSVIDLKKEIENFISKNNISNFDLTDSVLLKIYEALLLESKKRRNLQQEDVFKTIELLHCEQTDAAICDDKELENKLNQNHSQSLTQMEAVVKEFAEKDTGTDQLDKPLGWDDQSDEDDGNKSDSDDEDGQDEES